MTCHWRITTVITPSLPHRTATMTNAITLDLGHISPVKVECPAHLAHTHIRIPAVRMSATLHSPSALRFLLSATSLPLNRLCRNILPLHNRAPTWMLASDVRCPHCTTSTTSHISCCGTRLLHISTTPTGTCYGVRTLSPSLQMPQALPLASSSKSRVSGTISTMFLVNLTLLSWPLCTASSMCFNQRIGRPLMPCLPSLMPAWLTLRCSLNAWPPYFLSRTGSVAQPWNCPASSSYRHVHKPLHPTSWRLQGVLYSASRAGYDTKGHVSHLLFNFVLHRYDAYLWDTSLRLLHPLNICYAHISLTADDSLMRRPAHLPWRHSHVCPTSPCWPRLLSRAQLLLLTVCLSLTLITTGAWEFCSYWETPCRHRHPQWWSGNACWTAWLHWKHWSGGGVFTCVLFSSRFMTSGHSHRTPPRLLLAACLALLHFLYLVQGQPVLVMTNITTVA